MHHGITWVETLIESHRPEVLYLGGLKSTFVGNHSDANGLSVIRETWVEIRGDLQLAACRGLKLPGAHGVYGEARIETFSDAMIHGARSYCGLKHVQARHRLQLQGGLKHGFQSVTRI
jgi:hypothetical protein